MSQGFVCGRYGQGGELTRGDGSTTWSVAPVVVAARAHGVAVEAEVLSFIKSYHPLAQLGYTDRQIATEVGWKVLTVRKWRCRVQQQGRKSLASKMGRPATGALSTYPPLVRETLRTWRVAHPGWGPKTLRAELEADERFPGKGLPSWPSIARFCRLFHYDDFDSGSRMNGLGKLRNLARGESLWF